VKPQIFAVGNIVCVMFKQFVSYVKGIESLNSIFKGQEKPVNITHHMYILAINN
jgi:hypothetical protein